MSRKRLVFGAICIAIGGLVYAFFCDRGPTYAGRSLGAWVCILGQPTEDLRSERDHEAATEAVRHIGTNAIPFLLPWLQYEPGPPRFGHQLALMLEKIPGRPGSRSLDDPQVRTELEVRARGAKNAFQVLGATAAPAIPQLSSIVRSAAYSAVSDRAANSLAGIGAPAVPALLDLLTNNPDASSRLYVIYAIGNLGTNATPAIPVLIKYYHEGRYMDKGATAFVLKDLGVNLSDSP